MNYIRLNQVTQVMLSPIPRCNNASMYDFGNRRFYFLLDCPMRYHHTVFNKQSHPKLAFAGPNATMYTYRVMPFGPANGPAIFIAMMFNLCAKWQQFSCSCGVIINNDNDNKIIKDDLFHHTLTEDISFIYMECIFEIAARRQLFLSLT